MSEQSKDLAQLQDALETVRRVTALHYLGGGFDPEHMRAISNYCAAILDGESVPDDLSVAPEAYFIGVLRENGWEVRRLDLSPHEPEEDEDARD